MRIEMKLFSLVLPAVLALGWGVAAAAQSAPAEEQKPQPEAKAAAPSVPAEMQQKAKTYKGSAVPPRDLKKLSDGHWTPYTPPEEAAGGEWYVIQQGDTLSQLAQQKLGTWLLWPQIWDENPYIKDAHWIYPGDPLLIGKPQVVSETVPIESEMGSTPKAETEAAPTGLALEEEAPQPPINAHDVYCSGFITKNFKLPHLTVLGSQRPETLSLAQGDVIYVNEGKAEGLQPGDKFSILRVGQHVSHPITGRELGRYVQRVGEAKILAIEPHTAIAVISASCDEINVGNVLVPWKPIPIPWDVKRAEALPLQIDTPDKVQGRVIWSSDRLEATGESNIIYVDLGSRERLAPGDKLWIYRYPAAQGSLISSTTDLFRQQKIDVGEKDLFRPKKVGTYKGSQAHAEQAAPADTRVPEGTAKAEATDGRMPEGDIYRGNTEGVKSIRMYIGEGVVLTTEAGTACVKVIKSSQEIGFGDWVTLE